MLKTVKTKYVFATESIDSKNQLGSYSTEITIKQSM